MNPKNRPLAFLLDDALLCALSLVLLLQTGCALFVPDRGPTFQLAAKHLVPESRSLRIATMPLYFPVGVAGAVVDAAIVHPAVSARVAAGDTGNLLWSHWNWDEKYMTESLILPWRVVLTPIVYTGDFAGRSLFEIPKKADWGPREKRLEEAAARAETLLEEGKARQAYVLLRDEIESGPISKKNRENVLLLLCKAAYAAGDSSEFPHVLEEYAWELPDNAGFRALLDDAGRSESPTTRWAVILVRHRYARRLGVDHAGNLADGLRDSNPVVRSKVLDLIGPEFEEASGVAENVIEELERVAHDDPDPFNRETAARLLREVKETVKEE